ASGKDLPPDPCHAGRLKRLAELRFCRFRQHRNRVCRLGRLKNGACLCSRFVHPARMGKNPPSSLFYRMRVRQAASAGMLVVAHCILCRRQITYLASDLVTVFPPEAYIEELFGGACPRCGTSDFWSVRERYPHSDDAG